MMAKIVELRRRLNESYEGITGLDQLVGTLVTESDENAEIREVITKLEKEHKENLQNVEYYDEVNFKNVSIPIEKFDYYAKR